MSAANDRAERERCIAILHEELKDQPMIYTLTTYGRGETDHVRIFIAAGEQIREITYCVARAAGSTRRIVPGKGWAFGGGNYSKGLEAFEWACRQAGIPADQSKWGKL